VDGELLSRYATHDWRHSQDRPPADDERG
jgi:hypothetical protein